MRTLHKDLISYLPRQQLNSQWRDCCAIARNIFVEGIPNHVLVNKIKDYPDEDFDNYAYLIISEIENRGYKCHPENFYDYRKISYSDFKEKTKKTKDIFAGWHTKRLLRQHMASLQEKYDCGAINTCEWNYLKKGYKMIAKEEYKV